MMYKPYNQDDSMDSLKELIPYEPTPLAKQAKAYHADGWLKFANSRLMTFRSGMEMTPLGNYVWRDPDQEAQHNLMISDIERYTQENYPLVWGCLLRGLVVLA